MVQLLYDKVGQVNGRGTARDLCVVFGILEQVLASQPVVKRISISCFCLLLLGGLTSCNSAPSAQPLVGAQHVAAITRVPSSVAPTPRPPVDTTTQLTNLSNMPGLDAAPSIAVHPTEGWGAVIWANQPPDSAEHTTIFVKVQDARTHEWQPGLGINTQPAYSSAGNPDIAIDSQGTIHTVFAQDHLRPHYSRSSDHGRTWTTPEPLPVPDRRDQGAIYDRIAVAPDGTIHILLTNEYGCSCLRVFELERQATALPGASWHMATDLLPGTQHGRSAIAFVPFHGGWRTVIVVSCAAGCVQSRAWVATNDAEQGWVEHQIPGDAEQPGWEANWASVVAVGQGRVCIAWGYYAHSGNFSSCSFDAGESWEASKPVVQTPDSPDYLTQDTGSTPELLYEPISDSVVAVQLYRQAGDPSAIFPIYSYRRLAQDHWTPRLAGPFTAHQPALRVFPATRRNDANVGQGVRVASCPACPSPALAVATWVEIEQDENMDVYTGEVNVAALLAEAGQ